MYTYGWDDSAERRRKFRATLKYFKMECKADGRLKRLGLVDDEFPWVKDIHRVKRLPDRNDVLLISSYLKLTLAETNILLSSALYAEIGDYLDGSALIAALEPAKKLLQWLPFPAFVITRDDNIHYWNEHCCTLFNISNQTLLDTNIKERNVLRYIFDPGTPVYRIETNECKNFYWQKRTGKLNILRFKQDNKLCEREDWYLEREEYLKGFPEVEGMWEKNTPTLIDELVQEMPDMSFPEYVTNIYTPSGIEFTVRGLQIDYSGRGFPKIIVYVYENEHAKHCFAELKLPTPENGWGSLLKHIP